MKPFRTMKPGIVVWAREGWLLVAEDGSFRGLVPGESLLLVGRKGNRGWVVLAADGFLGMTARGAFK